jgi:hypothetical protein
LRHRKWRYSRSQAAFLTFCLFDLIKRHHAEDGRQHTADKDWGYAGANQGGYCEAIGLPGWSGARLDSIVFTLRIGKLINLARFGCLSLSPFGFCDLLGVGPPCSWTVVLHSASSLLASRIDLILEA